MSFIVGINLKVFGAQNFDALFMTVFASIIGIMLVAWPSKIAIDLFKALRTNYSTVNLPNGEEILEGGEIEESTKPIKAKKKRKKANKKKKKVKKVKK